MNFTGVVATDFPATTSPGVVYLADPNDAVPTFPTTPPAGSPPGTPSLQEVVRHSGFEIDAIAVNYDATTDTLNFGLVQPLSGNISANGLDYPVIAGDADNNGDNSTVNPIISDNGATPGNNVGIEPGFRDFPGVSGTESLGVIINLSGIDTPANAAQEATKEAETIVAGIPETGSVANNYQVAQADYIGLTGNGITASTIVPEFGAPLTNNLGGFSLVNNPANGAFEFTITHFSQLYQAETGNALTPSSVLSVGAFGGSADDFATEEFFHAQTLVVGNATTPLTPVPPVIIVPPPVIVVPPPVIVECSPVTYINPHQNRHVNSAHYDNVRVTVLSSSGFDATQINPSTVRLGGATPYTEFSRDVDHNGLKDETFVFRGIDLNLPRGITTATLTGTTNSGVSFSSSELIFNKNDSYYSARQISARDARLAKIGVTSIAQEVAAYQAAAASAAAASSTSDQVAATPAMAASQSAAVAVDPITTPSTPATVKIRQRVVETSRVEARHEALKSTVAATAFSRKTAVAVAPRISPSRINAARDQALESLASESAK